MITATLVAAVSCQNGDREKNGKESFNYSVDRFADIEVLRYQVMGFEEFTLNQKQLLYHLSEAALMGRDILFDQNNRYNLAIRRGLELLYSTYEGDRNDEQFKGLETYLKRVWFSNGIHHHYSMDKFVPGFSREFFGEADRGDDPSKLTLREGQTV